MLLRRKGNIVCESSFRHHGKPRPRGASDQKTPVRRSSGIKVVGNALDGSSTWGNRLPKPSERLLVNAQLTDYAMEQRRSDLLYAMRRYRCRAAVRMPPAFVTSGLSRLAKPELRCHAAKLFCSGARHGGFRSYQLAAFDYAQRTRPKSSGIPLRAQLSHPLAWA